MADIFSILLCKLRIFCQDKFTKTMSINPLEIFTNRVFFLFYLFFFILNKLSHQIKNSNRVEKKKTELDDIRKKW